MAVTSRTGGRRRRIRPPARTEVPDGPVVVVSGLHRSRDGATVLDGVELTVRHGELVVLLGRPGSGASTLLRCLAGLEPAPASEVDLRGATTLVPPEPGLLPWRTVQENVALALLNGRLRPIRREKARIALEEVDLAERRRAWPSALSDDETHRVSLARALVTQPALLLLDEPFAGLDAVTRVRMRRLLLQVWRSHRPAVVLATHDVEEALVLADRVVLLDAGRVSHEWRLEEPRARRTPDHPELVRVRAEALAALGLRTASARGPLADTGRPDPEPSAPPRPARASRRAHEGMTA